MPVSVAIAAANAGLLPTSLLGGHASSSMARRSERSAPRTARTAPAKITAEEAIERIQAMTAAEHARCTAFLTYGTYAKAARALDCDPETVSATWNRYRQLMAVLIGACKKFN